MDILSHQNSQAPREEGAGAHSQGLQVPTALTSAAGEGGRGGHRKAQTSSSLGGASAWLPTTP